MQHPFKIYSSSAGSGKTYTLTKEYLKLALQANNPNYYKQILAITFTNDAANEMKERILGALRGFADETRLPESRREANRQLLRSILTELNQVSEEQFTEAEIRQRAARTFSRMLHDYSDFAVSTIDSFVNRLVSAFTEELNIPFNYEVNLDAADLLANSIDRLLERVGAEEEAQLSDVLEGYVLEKARDGRSWNGLPEELSSFGMQLLNERVFEAVTRLRSLHLNEFAQVRGQLTEAQELLKGEVAALADEALQLIDSHGLDSKCFVNGSNGIHGYFAKMVEDIDKRITWEPSESFVRGLNADDWAPKAVKPAVRERVNGLCDILRKYFDTIERLKGEYLLIQAILKHFYKLSVIHEINKELAAIKSEKNVVHISDFNKAIINIVLQEPVPFIYERLGEKYNHILIDEFQDTSILQWNNLLPLVENGLAKGHFSLIVGDAKQAIYGWRGGDMEQIVYLATRQFGQMIGSYAHSDLLQMRYETFEHTLQVERLSVNYRSTAEIVQFNNELFRLLTERYREDKALLAEVYSTGFEQYVPERGKSGGHVQISFIDPQSDESGGGSGEEAMSTPYLTRTLQTILQTIEEVRAAGYSLSDIAVLNRSNKTGKLVANFLKENGLDVISQDSLLLQYAPSVAFLAAFFRVIVSPENGLYRYEALHRFHTVVRGAVPDLTSEAAQTALQRTDLPSFCAYFAEQGYNFSPFSLQQAGIYELSEKLMQAFALFELPQQPAYLFRFLDVVLEFSIKQSNHLADFLEFWENKKESLSVALPKGRPAVTVTSIHKSKGLEYPVVIVPFADWDLTHRPGDMLWMNLEDEALTYPTLKLRDLPIRSAAVSPVKDLLRTPLQAQFSREATKLFIENLNTLYVALTRPTDRLYLLTRHGNLEKSKKQTISKLLYQYLDDRGDWNPEQFTYVLSAGKPKRIVAEPAGGEEILVLEKVISSQWQEKARLKRSADRHFDLETFEKSRDSASVLRYALTQLPCADEAARIARKVCDEGLITPDEVELLQTAMQEITGHPLVAPAFARTARLIADADVLGRTGRSVPLPDRVTIVAKQVYLMKYVICPPTEADERALKRYAALVRQMGYPDIRQLIVCTGDKSVKVIELTQAMTQNP